MDAGTSLAPGAASEGIADDCKPDGSIVTTAVFETPLAVAVSVTGWLVVTLPAVMVKLPVVAPAATVTDAGTAKAAPPDCGA